MKPPPSAFNPLQITMSTRVFIYILDGGHLMTDDTAPYSSHDIAALQSGIEDIVSGQWQYDSILQKHIHNPWYTDIDLFMGEEMPVSGEVLFHHDDGSSDVPETWAAKYLDKNFILNDPVEMYPLLPAWGWPWKNRVEVRFSRGPWAPSVTKKLEATKPLLTVELNTKTNGRTVTVPSVWKRSGGRLVRC